VAMIGRAVQCLPLCVGWTITSCSCATGTLRVYFPYVGRLTPVSSVWVRVVHLEFTILGKRLGNGRRMISTIDCGLATAESEVRGGMDVLKVIFWDHAFQPRAAEKMGNFWYVLTVFKRKLCAPKRRPHLVGKLTLRPARKRDERW